MIEWGTRGKASVVVGGQFGSEGKGLFAAVLSGSRLQHLDVATTNAGAQAGHTTSFADGRRFVCFHLPTAGVMQREATIYINAGSIIEMESLRKEIEATGVDPLRIHIHPRATIITDADREAERAHGSSTEKSGSTQKGVGAAIANKVMRRATLAGSDTEAFDYMGIPSRNIEVLDLNNLLSLNHNVVVEIPQGTDLSLNHGLAYPHCTSRDAYVNSGLSDAAIHPRFLGPTAMIVRTFPIRVGHIYDADGNKLGDSGPFYPDSRELDWAKDFPSIVPERTTVTKRVRRIATWSNMQYLHACRLNQPTIVALNFCNYLNNEHELTLMLNRMHDAHKIIGIDPTTIYGFGPNCEDVCYSEIDAIRWFRNRAFI